MQLSICAAEQTALCCMPSVWFGNANAFDTAASIRRAGGFLGQTEEQQDFHRFHFFSLY